MALRHQLFNALNNVPRLGGVKIAHEGEEMMFSYSRNLQTGRLELNIHIAGEYYRVNCPFCNDTRHRLWINHMWGQKDPRTGSNNLWLAVCYNEGCLKDFERQRTLWNMVFDITSYDPSRDRVKAGEKPCQSLREVELPGTPLALTWLASAYPDHPACEYLRSRGYDPAVIGQQYGLSVCQDPPGKYWQLAGRLIIPIRMDGKLYGWQARLIGESTDRRVPKYFSMPGMKKTQVLYNIDVAQHHPFVVVCEGPTDVWTFGPEAVSLFGKSISTAQLQRLRLTFGEKGKPIILMLDGDAIEEAEGILHEMKRNKGRPVPCAMVCLSNGTDPGDYATNDLRALVAEQCRRQGLELPIPFIQTGSF